MKNIKSISINKQKQNKMKKLFLFLAIAAIGFASCSDDQIDDSPSNSRIGFKTMIGKNGNLKVAELLNANFADFKVSAYYTGATPMGAAVSLQKYLSNISVTKPAATWIYSNDYYWPATGNLQFFAYRGTLDAPLAETSTGYPTFDYTVKAVASQEDLIVAEGIDKTIAVPTVPFTFSHALTQINFSVKGAVAGPTYRIKKIELKNVVNKGTFKYGADFAAASWTPSAILADKANYVYYNDATTGTLVNTSLVSFGNGNPLSTALMLLPQTSANFVIEVTYDVEIEGIDIKENKVATITLPSTTWNKGKKIRYNLTVPVEGTRIEFTATVSPWETETTSDQTLTK